MYPEDINRMLDATEDKFIDICLQKINYKTDEEYIKAITDYIELKRDDQEYISYCFDYLRRISGALIFEDIVRHLINQKLNKSNDLEYKWINDSDELPF